MTNFRRHFLVKLFTFSDGVIMAGAFALAALPESYLDARVSFASFLSMRIKLQNALVFLIILAVWRGVFFAFGLYQSKRLEGWRNEAKKLLMATSIGTFVLIVAYVVFRIRMITPLFLVSFWVISSSTVVAYRHLLRLSLAWVRIHGQNLRRILIIGTNQRAVRFARCIDGKPELGYELIGFVDDEWSGRDDFRKSGYRIVGDFERFPQLLREQVVDEVVLALPMRSCYVRAARIATQSQEQGILVHFLTNIFESGAAHLSTSSSDPDEVIMVSSHPSEGWPNVVKRVMDVVISAVALIILAPLFLITAIVIRWDSQGPVFFVQERVGLNKRRFRLYKLRTMMADAEEKQREIEHLNEASGAVFKIRDDPRLTPVGKFLRKASIDELPQLFNVLKGDMSLVGPRPLPVRDYQRFDQDWQRRRFSVRPGITCLWQINGRSSTPFEKWMELDMEYIDHWSLGLDLKILAKTIPAILKGSGAA
jgi:exopolysaccharide biosynthesis polyprenyl glycosylphosphotransferase